jgi:hypothetical protein
MSIASSISHKFQRCKHRFKLKHFLSFVSRPICRSALACVLISLNGCSNAKPALESTGVFEIEMGIQSMAWHPDGKHIAIGYSGSDEVAVWNIETKQAVFKVPSKRRPINQSGQELVFSPDGKYLVVQDFLDTKNGIPKFPRTEKDPEELPARADKTRYLLARVWDWPARKEVAQLMGSGSVIYGGVQDGFCWLGGQSNQLAMHRNRIVSVYDLSTGQPQYEVDLGHPFEDKPDVSRGYWKMACHPTQPLVAMEGARFFKLGPLFGFAEDSGATPIVVADIAQRKVVKVLYTATPLNGVIYTADGGKLISFGAPPMRVWDARKDYVVVGEINTPNQNTGDFAILPGIDGVVGTADQIYVWDAGKLQIAAQASQTPRNVFRMTTHSPSSTIAVAAGRKVFLYKFHPQMLKPASAMQVSQ